MKNNSEITPRLVKLKWIVRRGKLNPVQKAIQSLVVNHPNKKQVWIIFVEMPNASYRDEVMPKLKETHEFLKKFNIALLLHTPEQKVSGFVEYVENG